MMSDEIAGPAPTTKKWRERFSHLLRREPQDRQQLVKILRDAEHRHLLDKGALEMIEGVLKVSDLQVRDIMITRSQMCVVEEDEKIEVFLPKIIELGHSRFPVIGENKDQIMGVLHAKELLSFFIQNNMNEFDLKSILRPAVFVPESKRLNILLKEFRANHYHMAIVVDEYGGVSGLVTIEDVLEQIVGNIEDEFDVDEDINIKKLDEYNYTVNAITPIEDFNEYFGAGLNESDFDTIGGFIIQCLGHVPARGEIVETEQFRFKVSVADKRRVRALECLVKNNTAETPENAA